MVFLLANKSSDPELSHCVSYGNNQIQNNDCEDTNHGLAGDVGLETT